MKSSFSAVIAMPIMSMISRSAQLAAGTATEMLSTFGSSGAMCVSTLVELAFLPQYLTHNTRAADSFQKLPAEWPLALVIVIAMPFASALYACVTGALTLGARPLRRAGHPAPARH